MNPERALAFHGRVELLKWAHTSGQGFRVWLLLEGWDDLGYFRGLARRGRRRAGQRFHCSWQTDEQGRLIEDAPDEAWFSGGNWSTQGGATITLTFTRDDLETWFDYQVTRDQRDKASGDRFFLGLVELGDDERPVDQASIAWWESLKGGPHSKAVAMRCQEPDFHRFAGHVLRLDRPATTAEAEAWVKQKCRAPSKKLFDHPDPVSGEDYWERYRRLVERPFITWEQSGGRVYWDSEGVGEGA